MKDASCPLSAAAVEAVLAIMKIDEICIVEDRSTENEIMIGR